MYIIETNRLYFREFMTEDALGLYKLNANPEVLKYTGDIPFQDIYAAENFIKNYSDYRKNGFGRWAVLRKRNADFMGWCGLKKNEEGQIDLGFRFYRKEWGKGIATEAASAALNFGFMDLKMKEIVGRVDRQNLASIRVLEKIGMKFWKKGPCEGIQNALYYKMVREDYAVKGK